MARTQAKRPVREPATVKRARKYGMANQMAHESEGKAQRDSMSQRLATQRSERIAKGKRKAASETGMNAGTMGGSRL